MTKTYSEKLRDPRWQKKRLEIFNRDEFTCVLCIDSETTLHVHHYNYSGEPWQADNKDLVTVCEDCHLLLESGKLIPESIKSVLKFKAYRTMWFVVKTNDDAAAFLTYDKEEHFWQGVLLSDCSLQQSIEFIMNK